MSFQQHVTEKRRLTLLHLLRENGGECNDSVLHTGAVNLGFPLTTRDNVREDLRFLHEHDLAKAEMYGPVMVGKLTERGLDSAEGRGGRIDGIAPPRPVAR
ncbi:MAG: hypothetical protein IPK59_04010 [Rhodospirillaceae bacterium]|nr:hypothetical protein [Rhodospirillaceae bacterium]